MSRQDPCDVLIDTFFLSQVVNKTISLPATALLLLFMVCPIL